MLNIFAVQVVEGCFSGHQGTAADGEVEGVPEGRIVSMTFGRELEVRIFGGISSHNKCKR